MMMYPVILARGGCHVSSRELLVVVRKRKLDGASMAKEKQKHSNECLPRRLFPPEGKRSFCTCQPLQASFSEGKGRL